jgi:hypothetical protein
MSKLFSLLIGNSAIERIRKGRKKTLLAKIFKQIRCLSHLSAIGL